jgi:hypothetical protein
MKGRTICPKCKHEFVLDVPDGEKKYDAKCPKCKDEFTIKIKKSDKEDECCWEEHGEPRKTILSSIKPKTNKPMIAAVILIVVFTIGITTSVFSESFIETSMDTLSSIGLKGTIELFIIDQNNNSLENVQIKIGENIGETSKNGLYSIENISLGINTIEINKTGHKTQIREILVLPFINSYHEIQIKNETGIENKTFDTVGCSIIFIIFSIMSLFAAIVCFRRIHFDVAFVGSLLGIFTFGFFLIGSILSIFALIVIWFSKEEFKNGKKGKTF